MIDLFTSTMDN